MNTSLWKTFYIMGQQKQYQKFPRKIQGKQENSKVWIRNNIKFNLKGRNYFNNSYVTSKLKN